MLIKKLQKIAYVRARICRERSYILRKKKQKDNKHTSNNLSNIYKKKKTMKLNLTLTLIAVLCLTAERMLSAYLHTTYIDDYINISDNIFCKHNKYSTARNMAKHRLM